MRYLKQNTDQYISVGPFIDKTTGIDLEDALTVTSMSGVIVASTHVGASTHTAFTPSATAANDWGMVAIGHGGLYDLKIPDSEINFVGSCKVGIWYTAEALPIWEEFIVIPANVWDSIMGTDLLDVSTVQWTGTAVHTPGTAGVPIVEVHDAQTVPANVTQIGGVVQSLTDFKDFVDTGYDPSTHKVQGVVLADTTTTATTTTNLTNAPTNGDLTATMKTSVQTACDAAIVAENLDHVAKVATAGVDMTTEVTDGSIISRIISNSDTSLFVPATHSLQIVGADVAAVHAHAGTIDTNVTEALTRIPDATAGAAGGLLIAGTNDSLDFTNAVTLKKGLTITQATTNGDGISVTGNGTGSGISVNAGATGVGMKVATTAGDGISIVPTGGNGATITANGTSKHGIIITGGTAGASDGLKAVAGTGGVDIRGAITGNITGTVSKSAATIAVGDIANNAITAAAIADGAIDNATFAADVGSTGGGTNIIALAVDKSLELAKVPKSDSNVTFNSTALASINAEVVDALHVDTHGEPTQGAPPATDSIAHKIGYMYKFMRNKIETTATLISVYDDSGAIVDHKSTISDNGTTFSRGEFVTGA